MRSIQEKNESDTESNSTFEHQLNQEELDKKIMKKLQKLQSKNHVVNRRIPRRSSMMTPISIRPRSAKKLANKDEPKQVDNLDQRKSVSEIFKTIAQYFTVKLNLMETKKNTHLPMRSKTKKNTCPPSTKFEPKR